MPILSSSSPEKKNPNQGQSDDQGKEKTSRRSPKQAGKESKKKAGQKVPASGKTGKKSAKKRRSFGKKWVSLRKKTGKLYPYFHLSIGTLFALLFLAGSFNAGNRLVELSKKTEKARGQRKALEEKETSLKILSQSLDSFSEEIAVVDDSLPDEEGIIEFVSQFKNISQDVSVPVFKFTTDSPQVDENKQYFIDFSAEINGSFDRLVGFLHRLVTLPYLIKLKMVDLTTISQTESQLVLEARIYVDNPFFKQSSF